MKLQLIKIRDSLMDSFWFLPGVMVLLATAGALSLVSLDHTLGALWVKNIGWVWSGGPDGARAVLSIIAGSVMTVTSIVFSLTITTLAQTSSHFGPRVLRNFTSNRFVQFTLGTFIATFVYCLLVLRTVRSVEEAPFVPYLAVNLGMLFALASLAVLIFFIDHISQMIQAENLIADVGNDFQKALPILFPETRDKDADAPDTSMPEESHWKDARPIKIQGNGYLLRVDESQIMNLAVKHDLQIKLERRPGDFVSTGTIFLQATPSSHLTPQIEDALRNCMSLGHHRTPHQDPLYSIQQLVEIAAHALSPGINEPFTALTCIDWIGASLRGMCARDFPSPLRQDKDGKLRIVARTLTFPEVAGCAFDQIRLYGASNALVLTSLLDAIAAISYEIHRDTDRVTLINQALLIETDATQVPNQKDRERVSKHLQATLKTLAVKP
ncbi:MAG: DUF2254 domain-containing protein [Chthoniobacterales bacterium]